MRLVNIFSSKKTKFNHVLVQIYENKNKKKQKLVHIANKTKDMPKNATMVFVVL